MSPKKTETKDYGDPLPFDPDFHGPLKNRSCTDIFCLLLFFTFIGCWIGIGIYAFTEGNINVLLTPKDSKGRLCGYDKGMEEKPYLFFFDISKCAQPLVALTGCPTNQICVSRCPDKPCINNKANCGNDFTDPDTSKTPDWYLPSKPFKNRCIPSLDVDLTEFKEFIDSDDLTKAVKNMKIFSEAQQVGQNVIEDIGNSWVNIVLGILLGAFICGVFILLLRWFAGIMVWISLIGIVALLVGGVYFTVTQYLEYKNADEDTYDDKEKETKQYLFLAAACILSLILFIILIILIFLRKRIVLAIALIKEGSKAVASVMSVLIFPIIPWILQAGIIAYAIGVAMYLTTVGDPTYKFFNATNETQCELYNTPCSPGNSTISEKCMCKFTHVENPDVIPYLHVVNVFGFFWVAFFFSAFGEMVLASVFAQWYWTYDKRKLPFFAVSEATLRTLRYHIGTLAFGSLIIAICRMIRVMLEYVDQKLKKYDNPFVKALLCCLKCFFWCLEKFLKFINKNAYIMCAVHGKNFCSSAKDAFLLLMRNIVRVFVLDKVTDFLFFISKLLVTLGVGALSYLFFVSELFEGNDGLHYGVVPVILIMVSTYLIATVFFNVYSMAVDTLFLCFLEDCERNDGSSSKPYFMSKSLMGVLGKKNKRN